MSYYKYLKQYSPSFLRKYQTDTYAHLSRSSRFAEIVNMNATSTLSIDEDLTLNLSVPFSITNFLGFLAVIYWYFYHVDMNAANTIKNRLRSYHNYKTWSRLEIAIAKSNVEPGKIAKAQIEDLWYASRNITREQFQEVIQRTQNGEKYKDVLASWGKRLSDEEDTLVDL